MVILKATLSKDKTITLFGDGQRHKRQQIPIVRHRNKRDIGQKSRLKA
jgi:hypothetical protein